MNVIICIVAALMIAVIIITIICLVNNPCISCNELAIMCKSCKHYNPPLVASNYEPKEGEMEEIDFLAKRINALTDEEFLQLSKLVVRGYENGRD